MRFPQFEAVQEFNEVFGHAVRDIPTLDQPDLDSRLNIFLEEVAEIQTALTGYRKALDAVDAESADHWEVEFLDGLADALVTLCGLAQATGMPLAEAFDAVQESNMSKLGEDGKPIYYPMDHPLTPGKIAKGPNYKTPTEDLKRLLGQ